MADEALELRAARAGGEAEFGGVVVAMGVDVVAAGGEVLLELAKAFSSAGFREGTAIPRAVQYLSRRCCSGQ